MKIDYNIDKGGAIKSFLQDASISFYLQGVFEKYEKEFQELENLNITLVHVPYTASNSRESKGYCYSNEDKDLSMEITFHTYQNSKGNEEYPSSQEVFNDIAHVMKAAVENHKKHLEEKSKSNK